MLTHTFTIPNTYISTHGYMFIFTTACNLSWSPEMISIVLYFLSCFFLAQFVVYTCILYHFISRIDVENTLQRVINHEDGGSLQFWFISWLLRFKIMKKEEKEEWNIAFCWPCPILDRALENFLILNVYQDAKSEIEMFWSM